MKAPSRLQVSVTGAEHGGEPRRLFFATTAFARFLEVAMITHFAERSFAVDFLLQSPEGFFNRLAFS